MDDPVSHCLAGNSLLLTGLPGTGKTHLARTIVARLQEQGEAARLVSKTHCSAQNLGLGARRPLVRTYVRGGSAQKLDMAPTVGAQPTHPRPGRRTQARAHGEHALRPRHLQLREVAAGRRGGVPHAGAGQGEAEGALPLQARVAGHHAGHQPQQEHGRQRSGEPGPGAGGLKAAPIESHPHGVVRSGNTWV